MSNKIGKISAIKREFNTSGQQTLQSGLAAKGLTRVPGTGVFKSPYKEMDNKYRTGLDPDAMYIRRIQDPTEREIEKQRVTALKEKLEAATGLDLSPRSSFWNYTLSKNPDDPNHVQHVKLMDGDNYYDLDSPMQELTFSWLRVHPTIASSFQAWKRGDYPADTQFYVVDDNIETEITFRKNREINKAIGKLEAMSSTEKRQVARLMGLPISDDTKEELAYNLIDNLLKQSEFKEGKFKGQSTIALFTTVADMKKEVRSKKDLIEQAIQYSVYREKSTGAIYEGELEVAKSKEELLTFLSDDNNQDDLIALEQKLKTKKLV